MNIRPIIDIFIGGLIPFDLQHAFASSFAYMVLLFVSSSIASPQLLHDDSLSILDEFVNRGSVPAHYRKCELESLKIMMQMWSNCVERSNQTSNASQTHEESEDILHTSVEILQAENLSPMSPTLGDANSLFPEQILSVAEMVRYEEGSVGEDSDLVETWLWDINQGQAQTEPRGLT